MTGKRKTSGDAPGMSPPPAQMRAASTDGDDVSHGGDLGSGRERKRVEVVPTPQPLAMAGMDNSGRIDSFARAVDEEASSPSGNGEELAVAAGKPQPPPADQTVEAAEAPQPLPNDERKACDDDAPEPSQARREAENDDDSGDSPTPSYQNLLAAIVRGRVRVARILARIQSERDLTDGFMDGGSAAGEQEEVSSSLRPVPSSAPGSPSGSEERLAAAAAARAQASRAADHHVNQPAEAEAQPLHSDDESVASTEPVPKMAVPAPAAEDSHHLGSP